MKKLWMLLAGATLVMSSCSDNNTDEIVPVPGDGLTTLSEISALLPESRAVLEDHEWGASVVKTLWEAGDCISVWSDTQAQPVLFRLEGNGGTANGTFKVLGEEGVRGNTFYALYNGNKTTASKTVTLKGAQTQYGDGTNTIASGIAPMAATTTGEAPEYAQSFKFENLCGIMALTLSADADVRLSKLDFVGGEPLSGSGEVTFNGDKALFELDTNPSNNLTRSCSIDMKQGEKYTVYVVVPAKEYRYMSVDAYIASDPTKPVLSRRRQGSGKAFTIETSKITRIADFTVKTIAPHVYAVGDPYPFDATGTNVKGIVFEAAEDGQSGKIVALKDCTVGGTEVSDEIGTYYWYSWGPTTAVLNSSTDGKANTDAVRGNSDYPAFAAAIALGEDWYLPAKNELSTLFDMQGELINKSGYQEMLGIAYWSSTLTGSARAKKINYYDAVEAAMATVLLSSQSTVEGSVRAIAQF